jgi:hypothetical protein
MGAFSWVRTLILLFGAFLPSVTPNDMMLKFFIDELIGSEDFSWGETVPTTTCGTSFPEIKKEISANKAVADKIHNLIKNGEFKGKFYKDLATYVDTFGPRVPGTPMHDKSVDYMEKQIKEIGLENTVAEQSDFTSWNR